MFTQLLPVARKLGADRYTGVRHMRAFQFITLIAAVAAMAVPFACVQPAEADFQIGFGHNGERTNYVRVRHGHGYGYGYNHRYYYNNGRRMHGRQVGYDGYDNNGYYRRTWY